MSKTHTSGFFLDATFVYTNAETHRKSKVYVFTSIFMYIKGFALHCLSIMRFSTANKIVFSYVKQKKRSVKISKIK